MAAGTVNLPEWVLSVTLVKLRENVMGVESGMLSVTPQGTYDHDSLVALVTKVMSHSCAVQN